MMSRSQRSLPYLLILLGLAVLFVPMTLSRADVTPAASTTLIAGHDFATDAFANAWDFGNSPDISLDPNGPTLNTTGNAVSDGMVSFTASKVAYVSLLWQGVRGSLPWGRDGRLAANQIDAATYTRAHVNVWASAAVTTRLDWYPSGCNGCLGYVLLYLKSGWNDLDVALSHNDGGSAWSGRMLGLRLEILTTTARTLRLDFVRIYRPSAQGVLHWASPDGSSASLRWSDGTNLSGGQHGGTVPGATSSNSADVTTTDVSGYAPGTQFFAGSSTTPIATLATEPVPVIDSPSAAGCYDYAVAALGHPWDFHSSASISKLGNVTGVSYSPSGLSATNGGTQRNDPYVVLKVGSTGIAGRSWHRLTIVESYSGTFDLHNAPGAGTIARVMWMRPGESQWAQSDDLITPTGKQTITLDLAMPTATLTEPDGSAAQRYAFAGSTRVTSFRWDPNEDPGPRHWHLYSVRLAKDCSTSSSFAMTWHDMGYVAGSSADISAVSSTGTSYSLAQGVAEHSGSNTFTVTASQLPHGAYTMRIRVSAPSGATHQSDATGPLVIT